MRAEPRKLAQKIAEEPGIGCQQTCEGRGQGDPLQADLTFWKERVDLSAFYAFDVRIPGVVHMVIVPKD